MLLENLTIGKTIEINVDREGYCYHFVSKIELASKKRLCVSLIASNNKVFKFKPEDKVTIIYRDTEQIWEWDNVTAGIIKNDNFLMHYFDIADKGKSFNRRNAYRVLISEEVMIGYYDQYGTTAKSADMQKTGPSGEEDVPPEMITPKFAKGYVRDISETGVGICTDYQFVIGDSMFFTIPSSYGELTIKAKVVRKTHMDASSHKYINYYGCVLLQTENKLTKYIFDIQRKALRIQRHPDSPGQQRNEFARLNKALLNSSVKIGTGKSSSIKGIRTEKEAAELKEKAKSRPRPEIEGIRTEKEAAELKEKARLRPRPEIEGIRTEKEAAELKERARLRPRPEIEGIRTEKEAAGLKEKARLRPRRR